MNAISPTEETWCQPKEEPHEPGQISQQHLQFRFFDFVDPSDSIVREISKYDLGTLDLKLQLLFLALVSLLNDVVW